jgi:hypothetical protein
LCKASTQSNLRVSEHLSITHRSTAKRGRDMGKTMAKK